MRGAAQQEGLDPLPGRQPQSSPPAAARSARPGCSPRRTSCPGSGAHSSHGCAAGCRAGACGRTCTAPPACTESQERGRGRYPLASRPHCPSSHHPVSAAGDQSWHRPCGPLRPTCEIEVLGVGVALTPSCLEWRRGAIRVSTPHHVQYCEESRPTIGTVQLPDTGDPLTRRSIEFPLNVSLFCVTLWTREASPTDSRRSCFPSVVTNWQRQQNGLQSVRGIGG